MKRILVFICLAFCILLVCACGGNDDTDTNTDTNTDTSNEQNVTVSYKVTVLNSDGTPLSDAVVYFGNKMAFTDASGAATMTLAGNEFEIKVTDLAKNEYFIGENVIVTPEKNEITVTVSTSASNLDYERVHDNGTPDDITDDRKAYLISDAGSFYMAGISTEEIIFFLFTPARDGIYEFSVDVDGEVGYYGAPLNALQHPIEPLADENGVVTLEIKKKNLATANSPATPYLIGIKAKNAENTSCIFSVNRAGDPVYTPADDPYTYITNPEKLEKFFVSYKNWNAVLTDLDITSNDLKVVYNENDKVYHLGSEDGPVVYVRIGSDSKYLPGFYTVCETSLMSSYIYDDDGNYIGKEAYNALFNQYNEVADTSTGVYPLDKCIERAIKNHGNSAGWWNKESPMYLFGTDDVKAENAWLFACCTLTVDENAFGSEASPIEVEKSVSSNIITEKVMTSGNGTLYFDYISGITATLKISNADNVKVIYNGTEYAANNGVISVTLGDSENIFQIINLSEDEAEISFTIS